ncbi:MAG: DUF262 domain-containing protein [Bacilli bacterium]|nr:DUF262 domain-containing protein [Bacilli bacterium]
MNEVVVDELLLAKDYEIKDYFSKYQTLRIPIYQRSYAWDKKNVEVFITDVNENNKYYIGNIMTTAYSEKEVDIIDGQQRMISLFLILCCLKNEFDVDIEKDIELKNGEILKIEERTPASDSSILKHVYDNKIPNPLKNKPEVKTYRILKTVIEKLVNNIDEFYDNLLSLKIVEIFFSKDGYEPHNIFVNLNTKGKQLEDIEVLKSQVLKYVSSDHGLSVKVKEEWYDMLQLFNPKDYQRYVDLFFDINYDKKNDSKRLDILLENLNNAEKTNLFYKKFTKDETEICPFCLSCSAIFKHNLENVEEHISSDAYSFETLETLIKAYHKIKFKQFDIVLSSLLYFNNASTKRKFINNFNYINKFLTFIYMNQLIMSVKNISPSKYGDNFKKVARRFYKEGFKKEIVKEFVEGLLTFENDGQSMIELIENIKVEKKLTIPRLIIQAAYSNFTKDYKLEHFLNASGTEELRYSLGNCIPVSVDPYSDANVSVKLEKYRADRIPQTFIKMFLETGINESNYVQVIRNRTKEIAENFYSSYKELYDEIIR